MYINVTIIYIFNVGKCDKCGGELFQRDDDKIEAIKERLDVYNKQTKPLTDFYVKKGNIVDIETEKQLDEIFNDVIAVIK